MGYYLNSSDPYMAYQAVVNEPYFVDKSAMISEIVPLIDLEQRYVCITRPRRFGKTVIANMLGAFFSRGCDASKLFAGMNISSKDDCLKHLNQYNVIAIDFSEVDDECDSYDSYIGNIKELLKEDLHAAYPGVAFRKHGTVAEDFKRITAATGDKFIFILDEWDAIFHMPFITAEDKLAYLLFLRSLLKGKTYVSLAYMTGILPIAKYSSGLELNMFLEYTMATEEKYSEYFGFTESEVDTLYERYLVRNTNIKISREGLRTWYNGYHTRTGERVYNPRSVVAALSNNNLGNYWTSSGPYDEIFYYIKKNVADVREDLVLMISGNAVPIEVSEYAATSMRLSTRDEIFSAMLVYGFLSCENGCVSIPNKELMGRFADMLRKEASLGSGHRLRQTHEKA